MTTEDRVFNYIDELQDKINALEAENKELRDQQKEMVEGAKEK